MVVDQAQNIINKFVCEFIYLKREKRDEKLCL